MKNISKLRLFHAASSGFVLAFVPAFLLITVLVKIVAPGTDSSVWELAIFLGCFLGITGWIYNSDSDFQIYYCMDCAHEWPKKKHNDESCLKCGSKNWVYNYKP